jgi:hypothetical protein
MPALQAIAAAPTDREEEEENLQIMIQLATASPILPRVAVAESAVMPPLQAIAAAYATDSEEENLQILIPPEERLDVEPLLIPLPMLNPAAPVKPKYKRKPRFRTCKKCGMRHHYTANCPQ